MDPERAAAACDENTIGVVSVLGSTFTGDYEDVEALSAALDRLQERTGLDIPIHVDGASGGFVAPFLQPDFVWDFRLPRVKSINTSGHKYGLVYPGVGWIIWREAADLHPDLIFNVDYLGGTMPTLAINFSRPASQVVAQYYNLIRLGSRLSRHPPGMPGCRGSSGESDRRTGTVRVGQSGDRLAGLRLEA